MRPVTNAFAVAINQTVTSVGYLVEIIFPNNGGTLYWCDIGTHTYNGHTWQQTDFVLDGIDFVLEAKESVVNMTVQNLDSASAALILASKIHKATIKIYQIARNTVALYDAPILLMLVVQGATIEMDKVKISLIASSNEYRFAPDKRCTPAFGFNHAIPAGTIIRWGNEILTVENEGG